MPDLVRSPQYAVKKVPAVILSMQNGQWENLTHISQNLANTLHPGYKAVSMRFKEMVYLTKDNEKISYVKSDGVSRDFSNGSIKPTSSQFDIALMTEGAFFQVAKPDGTRGYTRNGQGSIDRDGRFVMAATGYPILNDTGSEITIPKDTKIFSIEPDGRYIINGLEKGRIGVVSFNNLQKLVPIGQSLYKTDQEATPANAQISQYSLEESNVSQMKETIRMMQALRHYESAQKVIDEHDQIIKRTMGASARNV
jgi:flagellar basal-body rod protein FlgF